MQMMTHEEFMALEGPVLFTEHFIDEKPHCTSYSNFSSLMLRVNVIDGTHFESILVDNSANQTPFGFDEPLEPWTIKGYGSPNKFYRVFTREDVKTLIANLQQVLDGKLDETINN